ncbi:hypothetical protein MG293_000574 [Ovis ammon polii]|uniref:Uncharacterized protein n=1 Tax=Ovis ammon polii TaxID=230172 RepID=A0AAD4YH82_OVIAM|nr:hypothetical protein MG293_000574 [Ovis ammon polii]
MVTFQRLVSCGNTERRGQEESSITDSKKNLTTPQYHYHLLLHLTSVLYLLGHGRQPSKPESWTAIQKFWVLTPLRPSSSRFLFLALDLSICKIEEMRGKLDELQYPAVLVSLLQLLVSVRSVTRETKNTTEYPGQQYLCPEFATLMDDEAWKSHSELLSEIPKQLFGRKSMTTSGHTGLAEAKHTAAFLLVLTSKWLILEEMSADNLYFVISYYQYSEKHTDASSLPPPPVTAREGVQGNSSLKQEACVLCVYFTKLRSFEGDKTGDGERSGILIQDPNQLPWPLPGGAIQQQSQAGQQVIATSPSPGPLNTVDKLSPGIQGPLHVIASLPTVPVTHQWEKAEWKEFTIRSQFKYCSSHPRWLRKFEDHCSEKPECRGEHGDRSHSPALGFSSSLGTNTMRTLQIPECLVKEEAAELSSYWRRAESL